MKFNHILFDLDGTLTDPGIGITNSVMYALKKYNIDITDRSKLYKFIGPPLSESFENFYGFSKEQSNAAVGFYREYYKDKGIFENFMYEGIQELLKKLKTNGKVLYVATSKPTVFANQILEHFGLSEYFTDIVGSELDGTRVKKNEVIQYVIEKNNITDFDKCVMIGDREQDIIGAKTCNIKSIGVLYGYGDQNELENAGANDIVNDIDELAKILESNLFSSDK